MAFVENGQVRFFSGHRGGRGRRRAAAGGAVRERELSDVDFAVRTVMRHTDTVRPEVRCRGPTTIYQEYQA